MTLAFWQLRQTWFLLIITGIGITCSVIIACAIPLLSAVTTTAGLHTLLEAAPGNSQVLLDTSTLGLSSRIVQDVHKRFDPLIQRRIGSNLNSTVPFFLQTSGFSVAPSSPVARLFPSSLPQGNYDVRLVGTALDQAQSASSHLTLLQGRLPQATNGMLETLLTPATAQSLHVTVGSTLTLRFDYATQLQGLYGQHILQGFLHLRIVGLFTVNSTNVHYWNGNDFQPNTSAQMSIYTLLIPQNAFIATIDRLALAAHSNAIFLPHAYELLWYYSLNIGSISYPQLDMLAYQLTQLQNDITNTLSSTQNTAQQNTVPSYPYLTQVNLLNPGTTTYTLPDTLEQYRSRVTIFSIPNAILTLLIIGIILFFVGLMADILIDRQTATIALLRSRGASEKQIFDAFTVQSIGIGVLALLIGLPLAYITASLIAQHVIAPVDPFVSSTLTSHPFQTIFSVSWYALAVALTAILAMNLRLKRAARKDVLALRRETARPFRRALLQHLGLDGVALIIAFTGYGISLYLNSLGKQLDIHTRVLFATPLAIVASFFLLTGLMILFLRFFPVFLRLGAWFAIRGSGAAPMLALAQMARTPRYSLRMTLLLALATAFTIFTLVLAATQVQRATDISSFEAGADFSGDISVIPKEHDLTAQMARYSHLPGMLATSAGYTGTGITYDVTPTATVQVQAVDTQTFAQTAIWTSQDSSQALPSLMAQLVAQRQNALSNLSVPAIVDQSAVQSLSLKVGSSFTVSISSLPYSDLTCVVVATVQHIPTINSATVSDSNGNSTTTVGVMVDYAAYASLYYQAIKLNSIDADPILPVNHIWLHTQSSAVGLAQVRNALQTPSLHLANLYDRRLLEDTLRNDPLYLNLITILTTGAVTALLLALLGDLLAAWLSTRTRLAHFVLLRTQGATSRQVAGVLTWEQVIVYGTALLLGLLFGGILSAMVVPGLVFTNIPGGGILSDLSSSQFDVLQQIIPARVVLPLSLGLVFLGLAIIYCLALGVMTRTIMQPSMSRVLRLNED